jgi:hypothetical protein
MASKVSDKERWVTMNGRHLLVKAGETPEQAWARNSKETAKEESDRRDKEIAEREKNTKALTAEKNGEQGGDKKFVTSKDGNVYAIEGSGNSAVLVIKNGDKVSKNKILDANDPEKARVKLTGKGIVYLKKNPNMLKLLKK